MPKYINIEKYAYIGCQLYNIPSGLYPKKRKEKISKYCEPPEAKKEISK